jgi:hypothetical protein
MGGAKLQNFRKSRPRLIMCATKARGNKIQGKLTHLVHSAPLESRVGTGGLNRQKKKSPGYGQKQRRKYCLRPRMSNLIAPL